MTTCRHCHRTIVLTRGITTGQEWSVWVDPEATGDDSVWRETCDANNEDRIAAHEPVEALPLGAYDGSVYDGAPCRYLSTAGDWCGDCPECETAMLWIHVKLDERDSATAGKDGE